MSTLQTIWRFGGSNLCTVWIGRFKLMANLARFKRENKTGRGKEGRTENGENIRHKFCTSSNAGSFGNGKSFVSVILYLSLMGRVKEMASLANLKKVLCNEGFDNLKISYLGELWVLLEFESSKAKELFRNNAVKSLVVSLQYGESFKVNFTGKSSLRLEAIDCSGWIPEFNVKRKRRLLYALQELMEKTYAVGIYDYYFKFLGWLKLYDGRIFNEEDLIRIDSVPNFNVHEAEKIFNSFIYNAGWRQVSLGESAFHLRFISDHRPILLREHRSDYRPYLFLFDALNMVGGGRIMIKWSENPGKQLLAIKIMLFVVLWRSSETLVDVLIDMGNGFLVKGSSIDWRRSLYDHQKRSQSQIRGVMANGVWIDDPVKVKDEFLMHFQSRFDKPLLNRALLDLNFTNSLTNEQKEDLEQDITKEEVKRAVKIAANKLGCLVLKTPFTYLGTKVGENMHRKHAWNEVVEKVLSRLSRWKLKTLSIGGRFTLLKSVLGSMPIFHMSIFKVPSKKGGLGVSSLFALNRGLLFKWLWRFYSQKDSLWTKVIKALYGEDGSLDKVGASAARTCWTTIVQEVTSWSWKIDAHFRLLSIRKTLDDKGSRKGVCRQGTGYEKKDFLHGGMWKLYGGLFI
ncbi:hypothetical protein Tco_0637660 [Tanacetum coccineum]